MTLCVLSPQLPSLPANIYFSKNSTLGIMHVFLLKFFNKFEQNASLLGNTSKDFMEKGAACNLFLKGSGKIYI